MDRLEPRTSERVRSTLLAVIANPDEAVDVRRRAVEAIGYLSEVAVVDIIERAYAAPDEKMRASALFAMGRNCDARWLPTLLSELSSSNPELRYEAARACGELEDRQTVPHLIAALSDPDAEVRLAAIGSLGRIGGKLARQALQRCLHSPDADMRVAAEEALEELESFDDPLGFRVQDIEPN